jgi:hypothetical protein
VTSVSKWEKQSFDPVTVPPTIPQHPVGSPEANKEDQVVDVSEAKPNNSSKALLSETNNTSRKAELASAKVLAS